MARAREGRRIGVMLTLILGVLWMLCFWSAKQAEACYPTWTCVYSRSCVTTACQRDGMECRAKDPPLLTGTLTGSGVKNYKMNNDDTARCGNLYQWSAAYGACTLYKGGCGGKVIYSYPNCQD